jgi:hypothetical protein
MKQYRLNRLFNAKSAGLETSVDIVSTEHPQFREIVLSALPFTDHLIINEAEASRILRTSLGANDPIMLLGAAKQLLAAGVLRSVTLHTERGAVAATHNSEHSIQPSLQLPTGFSRGATGAGDAFAAGLLYGLHEGWPLQKRLLLAVSVAASSLADPTPSKGVLSVSECLSLADRFGFGHFGQAA